MFHSRSCKSAALLLTTLFFISFNTQANQIFPYLDDANTSSPPANGAPSIEAHEYPRVMLHRLPPSSVTNDALSKYMFIDAHGAAYPRLEGIQRDFSPETMSLRHISARGYQSFATTACFITNGPAFEETTSVSQGGPEADGCGIYAGHWLYKAGARLTQSIDASTRTLRVSDASRFTAGSYVVIYDAPAGSFNNAEHARIQSVSRSSNTLTLSGRGFKSRTRSHSSNSIVAQHVLGQGSEGSTNTELWAFNMSSQSPRDANNRTFGEFFARWLGRNLLRTRNGVRTTANIAGILFDVDFYFDLAPVESDHNNDLVIDNGVSPSGVNWLGQGLEQFYQLVRQRLPNYYILGGVHTARGYDHLHGSQMENWLDFGNGDFRGDTRYEQLDSLMAYYLFNMQERGFGVPLTHNLNKTATRLYPGIASPRPTTNAPFRLGLTTTLMDNGYYGTHSRFTPDAWWDEYAVDVTPGSNRYGTAIDINDTAGVRQHRGWLGQPTGRFVRLVDSNAFAPQQNLIPNGSFDNNLSTWSASNNISISRVTSGQFEGNGAMRISGATPYTPDIFAARVQTERISVSSGEEMTVAFAARSSEFRTINVDFGSVRGQRIPVGPNWRRYVLTFVSDSNQNIPVRFQVGREDAPVWLDSVHVFRGNANVFRRDFENGIAIANATPSARTIQLGGEFQRISGTQDSSVNNGRTVTSVTIPPYDGLLLVRPEGSNNNGGGNNGGGNNGGGNTGGQSTAAIGDFVWNDANGNGVQGGAENGLAGVRVELRSCSGSLIDSVNTDSSGNYRFRDLAAGDYEIGVILPANTSFSPRFQGSEGARDSNINPASGTSGCLSLSEGQTRFGIDAGIILDDTSNTSGTASLGNYVWNDANGNGIQGGAEVGIENVRVELRSCSGNVLATTNTDSAGLYQFTDLAAGEYEIGVALPSGSVFSPRFQGSEGARDSNIDPASGSSGCLTLNDGQTRFGIDAGIIVSQGTASIGDYVWNDVNGNGIQGGAENGLAGVRVELRSCSSGDVLDSVNTDSTGAYIFDNLAAGEYEIGVILPSGASFSPRLQGTDGSRDSNINENSGSSGCLTLVDGQARLGIDAGIVIRTGTARIGDYVWNDANGNGVQGGAELGLAGVRVELRSCTGNVLASTLSDSSGAYIFDQLAAGEYEIGVILPNGASFSPSRQGSDGSRDSNIDPATGTSGCLTLSDGQTRFGIDAGIRPRQGTASLGDRVWNDVNGNGIQGGLEPGLSGVRIQLLTCNGVVLANTFSDSDGQYLFSNLLAGEYQLRVVVPTGGTLSPRFQGSDVSRDSNFSPSTNSTGCITLSDGQTRNFIDAGIVF